MFSDLTWKKKNLLKEMVEGEGGRGGLVGGCRFSESVKLDFFMNLLKHWWGGCRFSESVKLHIFYEFIKTLSMSKTCSIYDQFSSLRYDFWAIWYREHE